MQPTPHEINECVTYQNDSKCSSINTFEDQQYTLRENQNTGKNISSIEMLGKVWPAACLDFSHQLLPVGAKADICRELNGVLPTHSPTPSRGSPTYSPSGAKDGFEVTLRDDTYLKSWGPSKTHSQVNLWQCWINAKGLKDLKSHC